MLILTDIAASMLNFEPQDWDQIDLGIFVQFESIRHNDTVQQKLWNCTCCILGINFLTLYTVPFLDPYSLLPIEDHLHLSMSESPTLLYLFPCGRAVLQEIRLNYEKANNNEQTINCVQIGATSSYCLLLSKLKIIFYYLFNDP